MVDAWAFQRTATLQVAAWPLESFKPWSEASAFVLHKGFTSQSLSQCPRNGMVDTMGLKGVLISLLWGSIYITIVKLGPVGYGPWLPCFAIIHRSGLKRTQKSIGTGTRLTPRTTTVLGTLNFES